MVEATPIVKYMGLKIYISLEAEFPPTSGRANPAFTIIALALRLSAHLQSLPSNKLAA
jgi:hypothetical protein